MLRRPNACSARLSAIHRTLTGRIIPTDHEPGAARRKPVRRARKTSSTVSWASKAASSFSAMASTQLKQLRKTVDQLKARLEKEARAIGRFDRY
jgi:hypothetical protein